MSILFINHKKIQCGVYEFGKNIGVALDKSPLFLYRECNSAVELLSIIAETLPDLIIYNYHPSTMPWVTANFTRKINVPQIGIIHEVTQQIADSADNSLFNFHLAHDPTLIMNNPIVFKAGRIIPPYSNKNRIPLVTTIGSFGFGTKGKGFEKIVSLVQKEFDEAIIRFNIPFAAFGDKDGENAKLIAENCRKLVVKPKIQLHISHDFMEQLQLLNFIAENTINVFLYEDQGIARGISSVIDLSLAVERPIAISQNAMFRHILQANPSICVENNSLKQIIENGFAPLTKFRMDWTEENICKDYEMIANNVLSKTIIPPIKGDKYFKDFLIKGRNLINRKLKQIGR